MALLGPQIRRVEADGRILRAGRTGTVHGPIGLRVRFRVETVEAPRRWAWRVRCLGVRARLLHEVAPVTGGTRATLTLEATPAVCLLYPLVARPALRRLVGAV